MSEGTMDQVLAGEATWCVVEGDCLEVMAGMEDGCVDHVITDPPYTDRTSKNARSALDRGEGKEYLARSYITFGGISPANVGPHGPRLARRWAIFFCALEQLGAYETAAGEAWVRAGTWHRTNSAPQFTGDRPGQTDEGVAIMHRRGRKRWNGGGHGAWWSGPTINSVGDKLRGQLGHPTPKPEWLMLELVDLFTDPGDLILDPFAGSGTTGVAALRRGRRVILIEREPKWAELCRERLRAEENQSDLVSQRAGQAALFGGAK